MIFPHVGPVECSLVPGYIVRVYGNILPHANRFSINLQCGASIYPRDDVAFHFSPDFARRVVVRSTIIQDRCTGEETAGAFPFVRGGPFDVVITCENEEFKVEVDGQLFATFLHRISYKRVSHITIDGDIVLGEIQQFKSRPSIGFNVTTVPSTVPSANTASPPYPSQYPPFAPYPNSIPPSPMAHNPPAGHYPPPPNQAPYPYYPPYYGPQPGAYGSQQAGYSGNHQPEQYGNQQPMLYGNHQPGGHQYGAQHSGPYGIPYPQQNSSQQIHNLYPTQPGQQPTGTATSHSPKQKSSGLLDKAGMALAGTLAGGGIVGSLLHGKKGLKSHKDAQKKALKYGLPLAGVGVGAYAVKKALHHRSSSSSSSSSD